MFFSQSEMLFSIAKFLKQAPRAERAGNLRDLTPCSAHKRHCGIGQLQPRSVCTFLLPEQACERAEMQACIFPVLLSAFAGKQPRGREPISLEPLGRFVNSPPLPSARSRAGVVGTLWACKRASRWLCGLEWWALVACSGLYECFCAGVRVCARWCVLALGAWASACSRACCVTSTVRARVLNRTEPLCLKLGLASAGLVRNLFFCFSGPSLHRGCRPTNPTF